MKALKTYLVVTKEDYTDGTGFLANEDAEFGGEGHIEFKNSKEAVLGAYHAEDEQGAISRAAQDWECAPSVLKAYTLA